MLGMENCDGRRNKYHSRSCRGSPFIPCCGLPNRSGSPRSADRRAPDRTAPQDEGRAEGLPEGVSEERALLNSILERARNVTLSKNTTLSFERDDTDGRMYLHVKDKSTGEELYRIPKKYLSDIEPHLWQRHEVDVRI
jgi:uncharacterized FlaG/YvyC family protein